MRGIPSLSPRLEITENGRQRTPRVPSPAGTSRRITWAQQHADGYVYRTLSNRRAQLALPQLYVVGCGGYGGMLSSDSGGSANAMNYGLKRNDALTMDSGSRGQRLEPSHTSSRR